LILITFEQVKGEEQLLSVKALNETDLRTQVNGQSQVLVMPVPPAKKLM
jgi:hypothetical protein